MYTPKGELNNKLLELVQDPKIIKAFGECKTPEEGFEIVKQQIPELTVDEFKNNMQIMYSYLEESEEGLLSEDDLDQVAGGKGTVETVTDILSGVGTAAGAIGAVAGFVSSMSFMS